MTCPYCGCSDTRIVDSRKREDSVFRRRECIECGKRFNTIEIDYDLYKQKKKLSRLSNGGDEFRWKIYLVRGVSSKDE